MPLNMTIIEKAFYDWVVTVTSKTVIFADDNGPQPTQATPPKTPYLSLRLNSLTPMGQDFWSDVNGNTGNAKIAGNRRLTLAIDHFGADSFSTCETLYTSLIIPIYQQLLNAAGITQLDRFPIQNLSGLDDTRFEERARFEAWFLIASESSNINVGVIERVEADETIRTYDRSILHEDTIIVDAT